MSSIQVRRCYTHADNMYVIPDTLYTRALTTINYKSSNLNCYMKRRFNGVFLLVREPGPALRMFSAKFFSLSFPVNLYRGPSQVCNDHSQLWAFRPQVANKPFSGLKLYILKYCDVKNRHRNIIFGRKHLYTVGKATVYDVVDLCKPLRPKITPDTFTSEINIYKPF